MGSAINWLCEKEMFEKEAERGLKCHFGFSAEGSC